MMRWMLLLVVIAPTRSLMVLPVRRWRRRYYAYEYDSSINSSHQRRPRRPNYYDEASRTGIYMAKPSIVRDQVIPEEEIPLSPDDSHAKDQGIWQTRLELASKPHVGSLFDTEPDWRPYLDALRGRETKDSKEREDSSRVRYYDPLWELTKLEARKALEAEPEAGPQLYQGILSQPNLIEAIVTNIANEIQTELIPATALKNLFLTMLTAEDEVAIHLDVIAVATRSPSVGDALTATMFHKGLHALVCYRVGHRLWIAQRTGLAYYMQSTVSRKYSADIHPASNIGSGVYLNAGGGIVIGETAVVGQDVSILQGVTLGGTGTEEFSDRHPKVGNGVILSDGSTVLGNIPVGDGAVVTPKSIVTKAVPPLAIVSGIPARIVSYRELLTEEEFEKDDLEYHLAIKYMKEWQAMRDAATDSP